MILALPLFVLSYDTLLGCTTPEPETYVFLCPYDTSTVLYPGNYCSTMIMTYQCKNPYDTTYDP
jgi:hypothetical protein